MSPGIRRGTDTRCSTATPATNNIKYDGEFAGTGGLDIAKRLIERSDIVVDNYSTGVMDRFGLTYETLKALKADLIIM